MGGTGEVYGVILELCIPKKLDPFTFFQQTLIDHLLLDAGNTAESKTKILP